MATKLLRSTYQDLANLLQHLHDIWGVVADQIGAGYESAYGHYKDSLPTFIPGEPPEFFDLGLEAALHWMGHGKQALVWVPVVRAINTGVRYLYERPPNRRINNPYVNTDPAEFRGAIKHFLNTTFIDVKDYVYTLMRYAGDTTVIPEEAANEMWNQMALSPLSYVPKNWDKWKEREIAEELERRLYVSWAKKLAHSHAGGALGNYSYKKMVERLDELTRKQDDMWSRLNASYSEDDDRSKVNTIMVVQIAKWASTYTPTTIIDYPLPARVQQEMSGLTFLAVLDEVILGVGVGRRLVGPPLPLPSLMELFAKRS